MSPSSTETHLSFLTDLPLTQAALDFANERHRGQRRESDGAEFVLHPLEVASLLRRSGYPDHVLAAALLHDVLEDSDTEPDELKPRFGSDVTSLVLAVSDDPAIEDEEQQKDDTRDRVRALGGYAAAVYASDKISKVRELRILMARGTSPETAEVKRSRYAKSLEMLEDTIPGARIVEVLRFEVEALEELPPSA